MDSNLKFKYFSTWLWMQPDVRSTLEQGWRRIACTSRILKNRFIKRFLILLIWWTEINIKCIKRNMTHSIMGLAYLISVLVFATCGPRFSNFIQKYKQPLRRVILYLDFQEVVYCLDFSLFLNTLTLNITL